MVKNLNLKVFMQYAERAHLLSSTWYLTGVESGYELWRGGVGMHTFSYSVLLTPWRQPKPAPAPKPKPAPRPTPKPTPEPTPAPTAPAPTSPPAPSPGVTWSLVAPTGPAPTKHPGAAGAGAPHGRAALAAASLAREPHRKGHDLKKSRFRARKG
jgi:hypothetical protein